jgi:bile acid:Na+ symporter, BASS family
MSSSFRFKDLALVFVILASMTVGIVFPRFGELFQDLPIYCMMCVFFLSYLSIELNMVWRMLKTHTGRILGFTFLKSILMPILIYYAFLAIAPDYALSALLLTGVSTGVAAPFVSNMVKGNSSFVLVIVVTTSFLAPITLPFLIDIITVKKLEISLLGVMRMLAMVIFVPTLAVEVLRRFTPGLLQHARRWHFSLSLVLFAIMNLGIFWRYSPLLRNDPGMIVSASLVAMILSAVYCIFGILFFSNQSLENQMAGAVMMSNINNVLIVVLSANFFGPLESIVATMYMIPFFGIVIPLRYYYNRKANVV